MKEILSMEHIFTEIFSYLGLSLLVILGGIWTLISILPYTLIGIICIIVNMIRGHSFANSFKPVIQSFLNNSVLALFYVK